MTRDVRGLTLLELVIAFGVLVIGLVGLITVILHTARANEAQRENLAASRAAQERIETMLNTPFDELFRAYNLNPTDDPFGPGTASGADFPVAGLRVRPGDPDGFVGKTEFPEDPPGSFLREDIDDGGLMMPMDVNGDGLIDGNPRDGDYVALPVRIVLEWEGVHGPSRMEYSTIFIDR